MARMQAISLAVRENPRNSRFSEPMPVAHQTVD